MKAFLLITFCLSSIISAAQSAESNFENKSSRTSLHSRVDEANYYQYPSMDKYDVKYLKLNLNIQPGITFLSGTAFTVARVLQPLDSFNIELRNNMVVDSVFINGIKRNFQRGSDFIFIPLTPALPAGSLLSALFFYKGTPSDGVYAGVNEGDGALTYTSTLSESFQAREWFPVKQILKDKIDSADIWITTDAAYKAGSNGLLVAVADSPGNRKQYQWKSRYPMSYYMPSFSVGNYLEYRNYAKPAAIAPDSLLVLHYIVNDSAYFNPIKVNLDKTPRYIELFSDKYGLYPFKNEKYGHCHAYIPGCMEHQTMSTMSGFGSAVIAHELGHQWFGDNVTCARWNDIWLNEGFARYSEYLAIQNLPALFPTTSASAYMQALHDNVLSATDGSVRVPDADAFNESRIFSGRLTYDKGAAIIHTLRFEVQDDNTFFQILKNYQQQFKDSAATAEDFKQVAEVTSGKNLSDFFNQWYYGEGYPTFNLVYTMQGADSIILQVNELASDPAVTPFFKGLYEFTINSPQGDTTVKVYISENNQQFKFAYTRIPNGITVDPNNWVLNKTGTIVNGGVVVPVTLLSFNVDSGNCFAALKWKVSNEQQLKQYDIEYSSDGINFVVISTVNSTHSNIESTYNYSYKPGTDGTQFFRLKLINEDGKYVYSQVLNVSTNCSQSYAVSLKPNPVRDELEVAINQPVAGNTVINIIDSHGATIYKLTRLLDRGENKILLPVRNLPHGTYILRATNQSNTISKKFVKI